MLEPLETVITRVAAALPAIGAGLISFTCFALAAVIVRWLIMRLGRRVRLKSHVELLTLGAMAAYWTIFTFGAVSALGTMGLNVQALVAGLGLTGFALGFALRDAIANMLAGILILTYRPFAYGDRIRVAGFEGDVDHITLRYTEIIDKHDRHLIPNQTMYSSPVSILGHSAPPQGESKAAAEPAHAA